MLILIFSRGNDDNVSDVDDENDENDDEYDENDEKDEKDDDDWLTQHCPPVLYRVTRPHYPAKQVKEVEDCKKDDLKSNDE